MKPRASVLVADDHAVVAEALASSLERWFRVVGTVTSLDHVGWEIEDKSPDIVVLDLEFGKTSALTILDRLVARHDRTRFVILTAHAEPAFADAALRSGAMAYVVKESAASELRIAIEEVLAGRTYITPILRGRAGIGAPAAKADVVVVLTDRQRAILALLRRGMTHREIAGQLCITTKTVEYHIDMLKRRVGVSGKAQLVRWSEQFFREEDE